MSRLYNINNINTPENHTDHYLHHYDGAKYLAHNTFHYTNAYSPLNQMTNSNWRNDYSTPQRNIVTPDFQGVHQKFPL